MQRILAQRFTAWKRAAGLTDAEIAERLGVSQQTVQRWRLPLGHSRAVRPGFETGGALERLSGGVVTAANFDDPVELIIVSSEEAAQFLQWRAAQRAAA